VIIGVVHVRWLQQNKGVQHIQTSTMCADTDKNLIKSNLKMSKF